MSIVSRSWASNEDCASAVCLTSSSCPLKLSISCCSPVSSPVLTHCPLLPPVVGDTLPAPNSRADADAGRARMPPAADPAPRALNVGLWCGLLESRPRGPGDAWSKEATRERVPKLPLLPHGATSQGRGPVAARRADAGLVRVETGEPPLAYGSAPFESRASSMARDLRPCKGCALFVLAPKLVPGEDAP